MEDFTTGILADMRVALEEDGIEMSAQAEGALADRHEELTRALTEAYDAQDVQASMEETMHQQQSFEGALRSAYRHLKVDALNWK